MESLHNIDYTRGILVGFVLNLIISASVLVIFFLTSTDRYNLDHWKLNVQVPVSSLWMNLGFWKSASGEPIRYFDEACAALLREVLSTAGVIHVSAKKSRESKSLAVLDLGFGCGDQTWELSRLVELDGWSGLGYVGLTLNKSQLQAASRRLGRELAGTRSSKNGREPTSFRLFGANAAKPASWPPDVQHAVQSLADQKFAERWLLALDSLYHFSPSREPVLQYAAQTLGTNFMAFDLILNESAPLRQILIARVVGVLMGCPWRAFLTEKEYTEQLAACGYERQSIIFRDVSRDVFPGLAEYLKHQDHALAEYDISLGGGFRLARELFGWFGRTGVVKGVIVVSRSSRKDSRLANRQPKSEPAHTQPSAWGPRRRRMHRI